MSRFTFRFGQINADTSLPPLEVLLDEAEAKGIAGSKGERRWARDTYLGDNYLYLDFIKEIPQEIQTLQDDGSIDLEEIARAREMNFLLFQSGIYGFESRRGVHDADAVDYLLEEQEFDYELQRFEELSRERMLAFYKRSYEVRKFKSEDIGERAPNPHVTDEELKEITEDTGHQTKSLTASVGRAKKNLKEVALFDDGIVKYSDLPMIKARNSDGDIRKLRDSGRFDFGLPTDLDESERAQALRDTVSSVVTDLFHVDFDDDDTND